MPEFECWILNIKQYFLSENFGTLANLRMRYPDLTEVIRVEVPEVELKLAQICIIYFHFRNTVKSLISIEFFLFFLWKISQLSTCLIRTSTFITFWETCNKYCFLFLCSKYKKISTKCFIRTSTFIWFWKFFLPTRY